MVAHFNSRGFRSYYDCARIIALRGGQAYANGRSRIEKGNSGFDLLLDIVAIDMPRIPKRYRQAARNELNDLLCTMDVETLRFSKRTRF
jgi:hypothetical protein